ncbi:MAG: sigma-54-dependent Fis family transcriptional regulator [Acidobacteria bacterium]|nr:sigma-54-dependent Fis family transcriptional regulator [Acidobacteriota bacterium]
MRVRVLVVEDDPAQRTGLTQLISGWGFDVSNAPDGAAALQQVAAAPPDVIVSDLVMPNMGGLDLLRSLRQQGLEITTILLTAQATVDTAIEAIRLGAYDYVSKPIDPQRLRILLDQVVERLARQQEVAVLRRQLRDHGRFGTLIGASRPMREVYQLLEQAAPTSASVLITGESGTGKELVAQTIHQLSPRAARPFVPINCAAIPEALLESELFGHEKGAFTGAVARRQGSFELADRGTLFLDEIAEMNPALQAKLLRVVQERVVRPVGGDRDRPIDIRIVAATNIEPMEAVKQNKLREDLYYRLNVFAVHLPPLRERLDDLPLLVHAFITQFAKEQQKTVVDVDEAAMDALRAHTWPGNVRELRNVIERATIITRGQTIGVVDLAGLKTAREVQGSGFGVQGSVQGSEVQGSGVQGSGVQGSGVQGSGPGLYPGLTVDEAERQLIQITLAHTGGNKTKAAAMLGISLKTLHNKLTRDAQKAGD